MAVLIACLVVAVLATIGTGAMAHRRRWTIAGGPSRWGAGVERRLGRVPGVLVVLVVGYGLTVAVGLGLGFLAKRIENAVDRPTFRWVHGHVRDTSKFTVANEKLTMLGNNPVVQLVVLVAAVVLAFAYGRRWWLPVGALAIAYFGEKYGQRLLARTVDRGHPPTTLGTYPSGGVARILAVYGVVIVLVLLLSPGVSRAWRAGLWTGLATAAVAEAFTRLYLSKHWLTDAVFGLPFGAMLLLSTTTALAVACPGRLSASPDGGHPRHAAAPRPVGEDRSQL